MSVLRSLQLPSRAPIFFLPACVCCLLSAVAAPHESYRSSLSVALSPALAPHYSDYEECISIYTVYIDSLQSEWCRANAGCRQSRTFWSPFSVIAVLSVSLEFRGSGLGKKSSRARFMRFKMGKRLYEDTQVGFSRKPGASDCHIYAICPRQLSTTSCGQLFCLRGIKVLTHRYKILLGSSPSLWIDKRRNGIPGKDFSKKHMCNNRIRMG